MSPVTKVTKIFCNKVILKKASTSFSADQVTELVFSDDSDVILSLVKKRE